MAKQTMRLNIKGQLNISEGTITEFDKDLGEIVHKLGDLGEPFDLLDEVALTLSHDKIIESKTE